MISREITRRFFLVTRGNLFSFPSTERRGAVIITAWNPGEKSKRKRESDGKYR